MVRSSSDNRKRLEMVKHQVSRFEIWQVRLDPTQAAEIKKTRPCVVLSPNEMSNLKTAIVAPMTTKGFDYPTRIKFTFQAKRDFIVLDQIRAVDKSRLIQKLGTVNKNVQFKIIGCLQELFAF